MNISNERYWATEEFYSSRYLDECINKVNEYRDYCASKGLLSRWQRMMQNYYGVSTDGTKGSNMVTRGGDNAQLVMGKINDFRNIIQHQLSIVTSNRPAGQAKALNSDTKSLHQARIASLLTEYYLSQVGWEELFNKAAEGMLVVDETFHVIEWDEMAGSEVRPNPETGEMIMSGDAELRLVYPWAMTRDPYINSPRDMKWGIYSYGTNKWDLVAKFPEQRDKILFGSTSQQVRSIPFVQFDSQKSDQIQVYVVSHDKTPACPGGRLSMFIDSVVLIDGEFPYPDFNIYRFAQSDTMETPFGYTNNNDILALEEITDALNTVITTNQITFGTQAIKIARGANVGVQDITKGCVMFEIDPALFHMFEPLQLTQTAPEIFSRLSELRNIKYQFGGIDPVTRGDIEAGLKSASGSAMALIQAQSIQFNSGAQRAYYQGLSKVCTGLISILRRYADNEQSAKIVGKVQSQYLKDFQWSGKDLENVSSVVFEPVDPVSQTFGGKMSLAESLMKMGQVKNARQYINVMRTGNLDVFTEDDEAMQTASKAENENLRAGEQVFAVVTENHEEHIETHKAVLATMANKSDPQLVQAVNGHIQEHIDMWNQLSMSNPALLIATGQKVLPPPPEMGPQATPMGTPGGPPPPQAPHEQGPPQALNGPQAPAEQTAEGVRMPQMPKNPSTGERVPRPQP